MSVIPRHHTLSADDQLKYMSQLMDEMRAQSAETRRQLEEAKKTLARLEKKYPLAG